MSGLLNLRENHIGGRGIVLIFNGARTTAAIVSFNAYVRWRHSCAGGGAVHSINNGIDGNFAAVGGFIQHTTVTRDQITTRILHRWPDVPAACNAAVTLPCRRWPDEIGKRIGMET